MSASSRPRVVFAGTPEAAVPSLRALAASEQLEVVAVLTRQDAPVGRKRTLTPSPVASVAEELGLPVVKANRVTEDVDAVLAGFGADVGAIVAYGALLRRRTLDVPRLGWLNLHFSLLPAYRGAAPVQRALMAGEAATGSTVFLLDEGMDTGPEILRRDMDILPEETAGELLARMAEDHADLLVQALVGYAGGTSAPRPQEGTPTAAPKLTREDGRLDLTRPAVDLLHQIRGVTPEPGAWCLDTQDGGVLKVLAARAAPLADHTAHDDAPPPGAPIPGTVRQPGGRKGPVLLSTGEGALELVVVQPAGKKPLDAREWMRNSAARRARTETTEHDDTERTPWLA